MLRPGMQLEQLSPCDPGFRFGCHAAGLPSSACLPVAGLQLSRGAEDLAATLTGTWVCLLGEAVA